MDLNMGEILIDGIVDSFIFIFNIPIPIGRLNVPFWILLLGILFLIVLRKSFTKAKL